MSIAQEFSDNWKDLGSVLIYQSETFQFKTHVVICEFEDCLIKRTTNMGLYHAIEPKKIVPFDEKFTKRITQISTDVSIIIISNQTKSGKLLIDAIKRKLEAFLLEHNIPLLALFALKPNRLSKPHTGMWTFLNAYFRTTGDCKIYKACVVSNLGGRITETEKKSGKINVSVDRTDLDRAFANNAGIPYHTIGEFLDQPEEKYTWNIKTLAPEIRGKYLDMLLQYKNPNIFAKLFELGKYDAYMIGIFGAPRSGKTSLARHLLDKWRESKFGEFNAIKRLGNDKYTAVRRINLAKKLLADRISIIIDGACHTRKLRLPYEKLAEERNMSILWIEVNPGLHMSFIFNHVAVELSDDESVCLYSDVDYHVYKSQASRPEGTLLYCPEIKRIPQIMDFRY